MRKFLSLSVGAMLCALLVQPTFAADKPDLSSPKSAAVSFSKALVANDADALKATTVGTDEEQKAVQTMAGALASMRRFKKACADKWGADNLLGKNIPGDPEIVAEAEKTEFKIEGDTAKPLPKEGKDPADQATMKKVGNDWKVDLKSIGKEKLAQATQMAKFQKVFNDSAKEIEDGKYKSVEEAALTIGPRMQEAMKE